MEKGGERPALTRLHACIPLAVLDDWQLKQKITSILGMDAAAVFSGRKSVAASCGSGMTAVRCCPPCP